ncbi:ATP-binding protein [Streptomyces samsunensis]|uniref:ATP-binding protein n=2 Tax=Streptomyces malaysiensis TaxID=92644 RepID=A0ABX6W6S8_STRMQ|nr:MULTISPECIES: ATP-binding protein [Streptomyces]ATL83835.1 regulator [Streptomyces malaysiensis]MCC4319281.1 ATP-binding protein [Streptomyces malaysiensis]MCD9590292.1 ATP-binding protein [Streptomyces sp. 8ZJF_21]MCM3805699.1 ATP-binding protein [Streptomyces sp. DR7-3]MCQ6245149.1 ATP-binding protein [Streptomyces malaysiensis]
MGSEGSALLEPLWQGLTVIDPSAVSGSVSCVLPARYEAVKDARQFTGWTLRQWDIPELLDEVALVVSELVTNALRHALSGAGAAGGPERPVRLHLMRGPSRLVCAVRDPSEVGPVAGEAGCGEESGRGLHLVESFTDGWGWQPLVGTPRGKIVWAVFLLPSA